MSSRNFRAFHFAQDHASEVQEWVVEEGPLQLRVNGAPFTVTLRTPGADRELALGLLFSEGLVETPDDLISLEAEPDQNGAAVWAATVKHQPAPKEFSARSLASTSSCGLCGKTEWEAPVPDQGRGGFSETRFLRTQLAKCFAEMGSRQILFDRTGGSHAAAIFSAAGDLLAMGEDAGRHNAVDKAVGDLWFREGLRQGALLCVSGRVSYEIAAKARRAGLGFLAAVSAPSSMAVEFCRAAGMVLMGFCRGDKATVYSHAERLAEEPVT